MQIEEVPVDIASLLGSAIESLIQNGLWPDRCSHFRRRMVSGGDGGGGRMATVAAGERVFCGARHDMDRRMHVCDDLRWCSMGSTTWTGECTYATIYDGVLWAVSVATTSALAHWFRVAF